jgi:hypothetical protein
VETDVVISARHKFDWNPAENFPSRPSDYTGEEQTLISPSTNLRKHPSMHKHVFYEMLESGSGKLGRASRGSIQ